MTSLIAIAVQLTELTQKNNYVPTPMCFCKRWCVCWVFVKNAFDRKSLRHKPSLYVRDAIVPGMKITKLNISFVHARNTHEENGRDTDTSTDSISTCIRWTTELLRRDSRGEKYLASIVNYANVMRALHVYLQICEFQVSIIITFWQCTERKSCLSFIRSGRFRSSIFYVLCMLYRHSVCVHIKII